MRITCLAGFVLLTAAVGCGSGKPADSGGDWLKAETVGPEPKAFAVLAGNWTVRADTGERILRVDGTNWTVGTPPVRLQEKAVALFPRSAAAFEQRVMAGLQFPYGVVQGVETFGDGDLQVDFKLVGGVSDQFASLLFGLADDGNHYAYRYNTKDGDTALWKVVDGKRERLHQGGIHVTVPLGEWRTLRLRIAGTQLTGWVNDTQALSFTLPAPVSGRVGLWSKADSVTDYRRFIAK